MNALVVLSMLVAAASAGYIGEPYGGSLGYGGYGGGYGGYGGYGHHAAPVAYGAIAHVPTATSYQNTYQISRSALPLHYAAPAIVKAPAVVAAPVAYSAPYGLGHGLGGLGHGYGGYGGYSLGHAGYGHY